jgi:methylated-DNA-[protein]-cysteine S-methyltransferase
MYYQIIKANKEGIGLVWQLVHDKPQVECIYLPRPVEVLKNKIIKDFPEVKKKARKIPGDISQQIAKIYMGENVAFELSFLNLAKLTKFSARVLKQTCKISRGKVATYSGLAVKTGSPGAARAVGAVMANNPFPLVIPCHRVIRSDGSLGGFGGGIQMKKELLEKEGVVFNEKDCIEVKCFQQC